MACYVINQNDPEARKQGVCAPRLEDYYECLHHRKEVGSISCHRPDIVLTQYTARSSPSYSGCSAQGRSSPPSRECTQGRSDTQFGADWERRWYKRGLEAVIRSNAYMMALRDVHIGPRCDPKQKDEHKAGQKSGCRCAAYAEDHGYYKQE